MAPSLRYCASKSIQSPMSEQSLHIWAGIRFATIRCPPPWFRVAGVFASSISTARACARSVWRRSSHSLRIDAEPTLPGTAGVSPAPRARKSGRDARGPREGGQLFGADAELFHGPPPIADVACKPHLEALAVPSAPHA